MSSFLIADLVINTLQPVTYSHHGVKDIPLLIRGVDSLGVPQRTVYLPAGQLRGRLRHEAALSAMRNKAEKVKLEEAYMLALGQDLSPEEDKAPEEIRLGEQLKFREANPFLDLFGTWKLSSRLFVSHLLPEQNVQPDVIRNIRRDLDTNEEIMEELGEMEQERLYERQNKQAQASKVNTLIDIAEREIKVARRSKDQTKVDELEAKLEQLKNLKKDKKGEDQSENTKHLVEYQVIPAGVSLFGKLTIERPIPSDLKLIIEAFKAISLKPYFGAQRARGCGEINGKVSFRTHNDENLLTIEFGNFKPAVVQTTEAGKSFLSA
ncbi:MAG: hypothetical protein RL078_1786 [Bacteroidota bacterium]